MNDPTQTDNRLRIKASMDDYFLFNLYCAVLSQSSEEVQRVSKAKMMKVCASWARDEVLIAAEDLVNDWIDSCCERAEKEIVEQQIASEEDAK